MIIQQKRIRNLGRHLPTSLQGQEVRVGIAHTVQDNSRLQRAGFTPALAFGEVVLPGVVGSITRFNAEGKHKVRRDLPMETAYRQVLWTYNRFHGKDRVEVTELKDVPYKRYPREFIAPSSLMLEITQAADGHRLVVIDQTLHYDAAGAEQLLHAVNVCLELFGRCEVFTTDLVSAIPPAQQVQLNWRLLPQGQHPWPALAQHLAPLIACAKKGNQGVIDLRLHTISGFGPDFVATGHAGFAGYVVFGFPQKNLYVLESAYYGNDTYVFGGGWAGLSLMTKAQILNGNLHQERLIHQAGWTDRIQALLG